MTHELSDMLLAAKSDPPPARYTADDAVRAGRRLRRRPRVAWAAAVVVGAVLSPAGPGSGRLHRPDRSGPGKTASSEDLRRILDSVTVADLTDRATWFDTAKAAG